MNNVHKIEEFLKLIAGGCKNGYSVDCDTVYHNLIFFGLEGKKADISDNFDRWIYRFEQKQNIKVFVAPNWKYFCQFVNRGKNQMSVYNAIKLYIPLDKEHIYDGANIIFDFLAKENISHTSKIGKRVRFDDVVIRVDNVKDANKVIEFINNNQYIKEGFLLTNPFAVQDGMVSMAWDGALSYNTVVSSWVSQYIEWEKQNNNLDKVSYSRFFAFVQKKSSEVFEQGKGINEMADLLMQYDIIPKDAASEGILENRLLNYFDVTNLMLRAITPGIKKEELYSYINLITSDNYQKRQIDKFDYLLQNEKNFPAEEKQSEEKVPYTKEQKDAYVRAFRYMCHKYGYDRTKASFYLYARDGMYERITSYMGARDLFIKYNITKDIAKSIAIDMNDMNMMIEDSLNFALLETYKKYGAAQLYEALKRLLNKKDFSAITNNNSARVFLMNSMKEIETPMEVQYCLMGIMTMYGDEFNYESVDEICTQYIIHFNEKIIKRKR